MTDDQAPEPPRIGEYDASEAAVRRLLADARLDEPMPTDVVARLDDVLASLGDARTVAAEGSPVPAAAPAGDLHGPAQVTSLPIHRRRGAAALLVAAAAIVVGGVVIAQDLPHGGADQGGSSAGAGSAAQGQLSTQDRTTEGKVPSTGSQGGSTFRPEASSPLRFRNGRVVVRPDHFTADVTAARQLLTGSDSDYRAADPACVATPAGADALRATYQRAPAALVFQPRVSNSQVVDLFVCGSSRPVRSVTLSDD